MNVKVNCHQVKRVLPSVLHIDLPHQPGRLSQTVVNSSRANQITPAINSN